MEPRGAVFLLIGGLVSTALRASAKSLPLLGAGAPNPPSLTDDVAENPATAPFWLAGEARRP